MKKSKYILIIALVPLFWSCEKKFLDLEPISELTEQNYYENAAQIESGIFACYDGLQTSIQIEFMLTGVRSDNGSTITNEGDFGRLDRFIDDQNLSISQNYWQYAYNTIMRANTIIKYIDVVSDQNQRQEFEAEVRFIRALNYFNLVRMFGDVPLIDRVILSSDDDMFTRVDQSTIYAFIKSDLQFGIDNLPAVSVGSRPVKLTARALLGKVHLTLHEFSEAKTQLGSVISSGNYNLQSNYADVFSEANELNSEIIFAIEFKSQSNSEGQSFSYEMGITGAYAGLNNPTASFIANYEANDTIRKNFCVTPGSKPLCGKYLSPAVPNDAGNDWPVLRYADVLLMYGEAENELSGPTQDALDHLNYTRLRAGLSELKSTDVSTKDAYRLAMEQERRYELAFENHRWFDLIRTGRASAVMTAHGVEEGFTYEDFRQVYAIPQREIDVSKGKLTQNAGY